MSSEKQYPLLTVGLMKTFADDEIFIPSQPTMIPRDLVSVERTEFVSPEDLQENCAFIVVKYGLIDYALLVTRSVQENLTHLNVNGRYFKVVFEANSAFIPRIHCVKEQY